MELGSDASVNTLKLFRCFGTSGEGECGVACPDPDWSRSATARFRLIPVHGDLGCGAVRLFAVVASWYCAGSLGQVLAQVNGFIIGGQRLLLAALPFTEALQIAQCCGEGGLVGGIVFGERAQQVDGFLEGGQRLLLAAQLTQAAA
jgi:hypothetical protein